MNWLRSKLAFRTLDQLWQWFMQTLHCKQYSVRGSVIKTYNEPLTDYLQSISALVFSLVKHDTGWCLESWAPECGGCGELVSRHEHNWEHARTRMWHKQCRRWITWQKVIIISKKISFRDTIPTAVYSPDKIILLILCSVDTEVDIKKIRHERDYVRVVIMRQYETQWPVPGVQEIVMDWVWRRVRVSPTSCPALGWVMIIHIEILTLLFTLS